MIENKQTNKIKPMVLGLSLIGNPDSSPCTFGEIIVASHSRKKVKMVESKVHCTVLD